MDIKKLFSTRKVPEQKQMTTAQAVAAAQGENPDARRTGETYRHYGARICGQVNASLQALKPFLDKIYISEKNRQMNDEELQKKHKEQLNEQIINLQAEKQQRGNELGNVEAQIATVQDNVKDYKDEIAQLKIGREGIDKSANLRMWTGLIILIPLTVYLFMFYSSAVYSAFFDDEQITNVATAMLNGRALISSWDDGTQEFLFVLLLPVVFLGLGFLLHHFTAQKGFIGYIKSAALIIITFLFDFILAYQIGQRVHNYMSSITLAEATPYSMGLAVQDINFWAVIFCGFIAYIIWGLVFGVAYSGYEDRSSNQRKIDSIKQKIDSEKQALTLLGKKKIDIENKIAGIESDIKRKENEIASQRTFYPQEIEVCLGDFFTGWMGMMQPLGKSADEQQTARKIYDATVQTYFTNQQD